MVIHDEGKADEDEGLGRLEVMCYITMIHRQIIVYFRPKGAPTQIQHAFERHNHIEHTPERANNIRSESMFIKRTIFYRKCYA